MGIESINNSVQTQISPLEQGVSKAGKAAESPAAQKTAKFAEKMLETAKKSKISVKLENSISKISAKDVKSSLTKIGKFLQPIKQGVAEKGTKAKNIASYQADKLQAKLLKATKGTAKEAKSSPPGDRDMQETLETVDQLFNKNMNEYEKQLNENGQADLKVTKQQIKEQTGVEVDRGFRVFVDQSGKLNYAVKLDKSPIGEGSFKKLYVAIDRSGKQLALAKAKSGSLDAGQITPEEKANMIKFANTPGVAGTRVVSDTKPNGGTGGVLQEFYNRGGLKAQNNFYLDQKGAIFDGALEGLKNMHAEGYGHFDIWSDNILVNMDENGGVNAALGDLGNAGEVQTKMRFDHASPEQMRGYGAVNFQMKPNGEIYDITNKTDLFSMGCTMYEQFYGQRLPHIQDRIDTEKSGDPSSLTNLISDVSSFSFAEAPSDTGSIDYIIYSLMRDNPDERMSAAEAQALLPGAIAKAKEGKGIGELVPTYGPRPGSKLGTDEVSFSDAAYVETSASANYGSFDVGRLQKSKD